MGAGGRTSSDNRIPVLNGIVYIEVTRLPHGWIYGSSKSFTLRILLPLAPSLPFPRCPSSICAFHLLAIAFKAASEVHFPLEKRKKIQLWIKEYAIFSFTFWTLFNALHFYARILNCMIFFCISFSIRPFFNTGLFCHSLKKNKIDIRRCNFS